MIHGGADLEPLQYLHEAGAGLLQSLDLRRSFLVNVPKFAFPATIGPTSHDTTQPQF